MPKYNTNKTKSKSHLINILNGTKKHHPNFALLLGAGASVTSKVPSAQHLIDDWRKKHHLQNFRNKDQEEHFKLYHWYKTSEEYSYLFESLYDQPTQRRELIETCLEDATPSWGYIYLVNLIKNKVFNTVFTTNFDDLLNEACYSYSGEVRPIVCAHDSSIKTLRITSKRPKIIKLHGDFMFDNIKNTLSELESLETNMRDKLRQFSSEFGLIVVGYSGNDRSIMDTLQSLLKNESNFPHGIYWCVRKDADISDKVDLLSRFPNFYFVEIDGFDELFADINNSLEFQLPLEMTNPYQALAKKLDRLLNDTHVSTDIKAHPVIEKDIKNLGNKIGEKLDNTKNKEIAKIQFTIPIPYLLLSNIQEKEGKFELAYSFAKDAINQSISKQSLSTLFSLIGKGKLSDHKEEALKLYNDNKTIIKDDLMLINTLAVSLLQLEDYQNAEKILSEGIQLFNAANDKPPLVEEYLDINLYQIKIHKGEELTTEERERLEKHSVHGDEIVSFGAKILLKKYSDASSIFEKIKSTDEKFAAQIKTWPIFKLLILDAQASLFTKKECNTDEVHNK
jgi:tetratricopeptide (TPR) repeat protein